MVIAPSADSTVINGRLGTVTGQRDDVDAYRLQIDDAHANRVTQIKLFWRNGLDRQLCLLSAEGQPMSCARGTQNAVLRDLVLPAGEYGLTVTGYTDAGRSLPAARRYQRRTSRRIRERAQQRVRRRVGHGGRR